MGDALADAMLELSASEQSLEVICGIAAIAPGEWAQQVQVDRWNIR
jgi:hypothetical protein